MKVYIVTDKDIDLLKSALKEDPHPGITPSAETRQAFVDAQKFYYYRVHRWLDSIRRGEGET